MKLKKAMNPMLIDEEVCRYLNMLETMEADRIITKEELAKLRTKVKAWAYDKLQLWERVKVLPQASESTASPSDSGGR